MKLKLIAAALLLVFSGTVMAQPKDALTDTLYHAWTHPKDIAFQRTVNYPHMDHLLYGVAYYDEYMPQRRLEKDAEMMKAAGINVVRIAESTWSTLEPEEGVFDFSHIDPVLKVMNKAGIKVIIGTPTYAVPAWLVKKYPDVLAITPNGQNKYGARQNMDITNPHYIYYANRVIRKLISHVANNPAVIGYQVDNETKSYGTCGPNVQKLFQEYMKNKFKSLDYINKEFGLDYWSNRINTWDQFPSVTGSINPSLRAEFKKFQRNLVTNFLGWQSAIVAEYKTKDQFITQNFDYDWRGYSYGLQPEVNQMNAARYMSIAGCDIYHPTQDQLTGIEISFGGDWSYSLKGKNYLVMETEAQGFAEWLPYPGQLKLQAFSHIASGANMVSYWPWHSIHNGAESYWKGLLSHDFQPNPTYREAEEIGADFHRLSKDLVNLKRTRQVAFFVSNEALTAFNQYKFGWYSSVTYNDIFRPFYDALYKMNVGVDFVTPENISKLKDYKLIIVPPLYAASASVLKELNEYVKNGGHVLYTFKSGFSDQCLKIRTDKQPAIISQATGNYYSEFTKPVNVGLKGDGFNAGADQVTDWMELLQPEGADVWAKYDHPVWGKYAAITNNHYGKGTATYVGFMPGSKVITSLLTKVVKQAGVWGKDQKLAFPLITKSGVNEKGKTIRYFFNYSAQAKTFAYDYANGKSLLDNQTIKQGQTLNIKPWGVIIVETSK